MWSARPSLRFEVAFYSLRFDVLVGFALQTGLKDVFDEALLAVLNPPEPQNKCVVT